MKNLHSKRHEEHLKEIKARLKRDYKALLSRNLSRWQSPPYPMMMWLLYHAHYLFATGGIRWALDPKLPAELIPGLSENKRFTDPLKDLSFVLLSHSHSDHLDIPLLKFLSEHSVRFIVPDHMLDMVMERVDPPQERVSTAVSGEPLNIGGVRIVPFPGQHIAREADGVVRGCECTGYLVETEGRRLLFPIDVRDYDATAMEKLAPVDVLFAHLWLGRGSAAEPHPPLLEEFCDFIMACRPRRVVLAHLYSFQHGITDMWTEAHAQMVRERLASCAPEIEVLFPAIGEEIVLSE